MSVQNVGKAGQSFFGYAGLGFEGDGSYGSAVSPSIYSDIISDGFSYDNGVQYLNTIRSRGRYEGTAGALEDSGEIELPVGPENGIGELLLGCLGSVSTTTTDAGTDGTDDYGTHTFTPAQTLPSLTVELGLGQIDSVAHTGVAVDTLELSHTSEEYLTASFELPAKQPEILDSQSTPTYSDLRPFIYHDGQLSIDSTDRSVDLEELTISLENDVEGQYRAERSVQHMVVGERAITAEASLDFEDITQFEKALGATGATTPENTLFEGSMEMVWTSPEEIPDGMGQQYTLTATLPNVVIETHEANLNENDLIMENVTFGALTDPSTGNQMEVELINGNTTGYGP